MAVLPTRSHEDDAGLDLSAAESRVIEPGMWVTIRTGIAIELPSGTEGQIRPRSGLARDHGITVLNSPGTVDEGYRGEIEVILINHGVRAFQVNAGARIAQLIVHRRRMTSVIEVDRITETSRGTSGFGSTGD